MKKRVLIFGASGMVGRAVLIECLESDEIESVVMVNRNSIDVSHSKLKEIIHEDFLNYSSLESELNGFDACFWTLGISAVGLNEKDYTVITHDFTIRAAELLVKLNPHMTFCYVSGAGTDSSAIGRSMWARVKGRTENDLLALPFRAAYMFRPGYIQPMKGVKSRTGWYNALYMIFKPLYPLMKSLAPSAMTTSVDVGRAMIKCALGKVEKKILESPEINWLSQKA